MLTSRPARTAHPASAQGSSRPTQGSGQRRRIVEGGVEGAGELLEHRGDLRLDELGDGRLDAQDQPLQDAPLAIAELRQLGLHVEMLSGDRHTSAVDIGAQVGISAEEIRAGVPSHVTGDLSAEITLTDAEIRERMSGNICRCGAYANILDAVQDVAGGQS